MDAYRENRLTTKEKLGVIFAIPTLGLTLYPLYNKTFKNLRETSEAQEEAKRYNASDTLQTNILPITYPVLESGQNARYEILVPLNEKPDIGVTFVDMPNHKFMRVQSKE